jgi:2-methylcitrate dehydratase PrpD
MVGFEVTAKLVMAIPRHAQPIGFHSTGTMGSIGSAAAAARLLGLDVDRTCVAFGIAASMASGISANHGSMTKPLHAGNAARNGIMAARLAQRGFTANPRVLDETGGFLAAFAPGLSPAPTVHVTPFTAERFNARQPARGLEGKFSMSYVLARALVDGEVGPAAFTDDAVRDDRVRAIEERVHMTVDPELEDRGTARPRRVSITLRDGPLVRLPGQLLARHGESALQRRGLRGEVSRLRPPSARRRRQRAGAEHAEGPRRGSGHRPAH